MSQKSFTNRQLREFSTDVLKACGLDAENAEIVTELLLHADTRGHESHGVSRLPIYCERLTRGIVNARPNVSVERIMPSVLLVNADNGPGPVASVAAMDKAIEIARSQGICLALVQHSNHNGSSSFYVERAVNAGCIAFAMTNAPPSMAVHGAAEAVIGTNAIAFGAPTSADTPLLADMATAVAARGKIVESAKSGKPIPLGWALDETGTPTSDANAALKGVILPFAGAKGSALAIMVEVLCGVLSGGRFGSMLGNLYTDFDKTQDIGHCFLVINASSGHFGSVADRVAQLTGGIKSAKRAEGITEILMPGELEKISQAESDAKGILLHDAIVKDLNALASRLGTRSL